MKGTMKAREVATVLAALRLFQRGAALSGAEMEHFAEAEPLTNEEIDALCERINFEEWPASAAAEHSLRQKRVRVGRARERYPCGSSQDTCCGTPLLDTGRTYRALPASSPVSGEKPHGRGNDIPVSRREGRSDMGRRDGGVDGCTRTQGANCTPRATSRLSVR